MSKECCPAEKPKIEVDWIMHGSLAVILLTVLLYKLGTNLPGLNIFFHTQLELLMDMSWGVALGLLSVGLMNKVPR